ncbi:flagellar FliJ family protein [Sulfurospirillum sp. 1612]|uniref:flagellar FliJ family protein n=1 Tax=Sulfurospirillum sp. 1612 TaxID=3094835 RepID=UPI002F94AA91
MKSAFSKISKIKKQKLNTIENEIMRIQLDIMRLEQAIKEIYEHIKKLEMPSRGSVVLLNFYQEKRQLLNKQKHELDQRLEAKRERLTEKQTAYKDAQIDFEKIKYLEDQELMSKIKKIKKDEQKELDEMANILQYKR